jgi:hypothetical protein
MVVLVLHHGQLVDFRAVHLGQLMWKSVALRPFCLPIAACQCSVVTALVDSLRSSAPQQHRDLSTYHHWCVVSCPALQVYNAANIASALDPADTQQQQQALQDMLVTELVHEGRKQLLQVGWWHMFVPLDSADSIKSDSVPGALP